MSDYEEMKQKEEALALKHEARREERAKEIAEQINQAIAAQEPKAAAQGEKQPRISQEAVSKLMSHWVDSQGKPLDLGKLIPRIAEKSKETHEAERRRAQERDAPEQSGGMSDDFVPDSAAVIGAHATFGGGGGGGGGTGGGEGAADPFGDPGKPRGGKK
jgi:hypothetical protein